MVEIFKHLLNKKKDHKQKRNKNKIKMNKFNKLHKFVNFVV